jgi:hypothetical protein
MWGRKPKSDAPAKEAQPPSPLKEAMHQARVEAAERTGVVVDLRDAEVARLELLNEALDPVFAEVPPEVDLFDRGISRGETPRLWIDAVTHVAMGRDKRGYRFLHDSRMGRHVLAESHEIPVIVQAVTTYVARRLVERQACAGRKSRSGVAHWHRRSAALSEATPLANLRRYDFRFHRRRVDVTCRGDADGGPVLEHVPSGLNRGIPPEGSMRESIGIDSLWGAGRCRRPIQQI